ncbi:hypothetical protein, partial [Streptomyces sp. NPDC006324]
MNGLGTEFWELDSLPNLVILRNHAGHEIFVDIEDGQVILSARVNLANDDDAPLESVSEVHPGPTAPDDPLMFELLDAIRYRLAPAYGRQNVREAVTVLSVPLREGRAETVVITDHNPGWSVTMAIGAGENCRELFVTRGPSGAAPTVALLLRNLSLPAAQEIVRQVFNAHGHDIPAPLTTTPGTLRDMIVRARGEEPPRSTEQTGPHGVALYTAP